MAEVKTKFRPEFLNRIDEIILFHRLKREQMAAIVDIQIGRLQKLLADRKITLELDDAARTWLANKGYDPTYGARPLKRVIQKQVQDPLAEQILAGRVKDGQKIKVTVKGGPARRQRRARQGRGLAPNSPLSPLFSGERAVWWAQPLTQAWPPTPGSSRRCRRRPTRCRQAGCRRDP